MKKVLLAAAVMLCGWSTLAMADLVKLPHSDSPQGVATSDYAGVQATTMAQTVILTTACAPCKGVVYGVMFTSGSTADYTDVFDASSPVNAVQLSPVIRVFNTSVSTGGYGSYAGGGFSGPPRPVRFFKGLYFKPGQNTNFGITGLYYQEQDINKK